VGGSGGDARAHDGDGRETFEELRARPQLEEVNQGTGGYPEKVLPQWIAAGCANRQPHYFLPCPTKIVILTTHFQNHHCDATTPVLSTSAAVVRPVQGDRAILEELAEDSPASCGSPRSTSMTTQRSRPNMASAPIPTMLLFKERQTGRQIVGMLPKATLKEKLQAQL